MFAYFPVTPSSPEMAFIDVYCEINSEIWKKWVVTTTSAQRPKLSSETSTAHITYVYIKLKYRKSSGRWVTVTAVLNSYGNEFLFL